MTTRDPVFKVHISTLDALRRFAGFLAPNLKAGDVVALNGPLGAGKTTFVQHLCRALGVTEKVTSPTFVLTHEYHTGRLPVLHADLYRLGPEQADSLAEDLTAAADALVLVEWAEYGAFMGGIATVEIDIDYDESGDGRWLSVRAKDGALRQALAEQWAAHGERA